MTYSGCRRAHRGDRDQPRSRALLPSLMGTSGSPSCSGAGRVLLCLGRHCRRTDLLGGRQHSLGPPTRSRAASQPARTLGHARLLRHPPQVALAEHGRPARLAAPPRRCSSQRGNERSRRVNSRCAPPQPPLSTARFPRTVDRCASPPGIPPTRAVRRCPARRLRATATWPRWGGVDTGPRGVPRPLRAGRRRPAPSVLAAARALPPATGPCSSGRGPDRRGRRPVVRLPAPRHRPRRRHRAKARRRLPVGACVFMALPPPTRCRPARQHFAATVAAAASRCCTSRATTSPKCGGMVPASWRGGGAGHPSSRSACVGTALDRLTAPGGTGRHRRSRGGFSSRRHAGHGAPWPAVRPR